MSDKYIPEVYCVYIPSLFNDYLSQNKLKLEINDVWQFDKLEKFFPLEDIFFFIYNQTNDPSFVKFMTDNDLFNVLTHPKNITWMKKMENKYNQYLQKNQFSQKDLLIEDVLTRYDVYENNKSSRNTNENVIIFYDANITDEPDLLVQREILTKRRNKLRNQLFDMLGFTDLCKHKVMRYLTKLI